MLERSCLGCGSIVLADLLKAETTASAAVPVYSDLAARSTHFPAKAKAVIQLVQNGGPSPMGLFDPKPQQPRRGRPPPPPGVQNHPPRQLNTTPPTPFRLPNNAQCPARRSAT